jgi:hypothetical protein
LPAFKLTDTAPALLQRRGHLSLQYALYAHACAAVVCRQVAVAVHTAVLRHRARRSATD